MGILEVAAFAASADLAPPFAAIAETPRATSSLASAVVATRPTVFNSDVLAFDEASLTKPLAKPREVVGPGFWRCNVEKPDHRQRWLLPTRRKRPSVFLLFNINATFDIYDTSCLAFSVLKNLTARFSL